MLPHTSLSLVISIATDGPGDVKKCLFGFIIFLKDRFKRRHDRPPALLTACSFVAY